MVDTNAQEKRFERTAKGQRSRWEIEITAAIKHLEDDKYYTIGRKAVKVYSSRIRTAGSGAGSGSGVSAVRYNIYWTFINVLKRAVFARAPKVVVKTTIGHETEVTAMAEKLLERTLGYYVNHVESSFLKTAKMCVMDFLLPGRGTLWPVYRYTGGEEREVYLSPGEMPPEDNDGDDYELTEIVGPNGERQEVYARKEQELLEESVEAEYVHWEDYLESPGRTPQEVRWRAKRAFLTKEQVKEKFGKKIADEIGYESKISDPGDMGKREDVLKYRIYQRAEVWEIHDFENKEIIFYCKDLDRLLKTEKDLLGLKHFFSCPGSLKYTLTNDDTTPVSGYATYGYLIDKINTLVIRREALLRALKVAAAYDAKIVKLRDVFNSVETSMIPVQDWGAFAESGGFKGVIDFLPIEMYASALELVSAQIEKYKSEFYEITGYSELMRGEVQGRVNSAEVQAASEFTDLRIADDQEAVQTYLRDVIAIMGELVAKKFSLETMLRLSGEEVDPILQVEDPQQWQQKTGLLQEAFALLRDDVRRDFTIEIETDSTIAMDERKEKRDRIEFMNMSTQFFGLLQNLSQQAPVFVPAAISSFLFVLDTFRVARPIEADLKQGLAAFMQEVEKKKQQPPEPNPEMLKIQQMAESNKAEIQFKYAELEADVQQKMADAQMKFQIKVSETQSENKERSERLALDMQQFVQEMNYKYEMLKGQIVIANAKNDASMVEAQIKSAAAAQAVDRKAQMSIMAKLKETDMRIQGEKEAQQMQIMADMAAKHGDIRVGINKAMIDARTKKDVAGLQHMASMQQQEKEEKGNERNMEKNKR